MKSRQDRQRAIERLIRQGSYRTQQEMIQALSREGMAVNQGTLSKDLNEMHVIKARTANSQVKYVLPYNYSSETQDELVRREIRDFVRTADSAVNLVVLTTASGHASGVCESIDQAAWPEIVGSIAGENTILLITKSVEQAEQLLERFKDIMEGTS